MPPQQNAAKSCPQCGHSPVDAFRLAHPRVLLLEWCEFCGSLALARDEFIEPKQMPALRNTACALFLQLELADIEIPAVLDAVRVLRTRLGSPVANGPALEVEHYVNVTPHRVRVEDLSPGAVVDFGREAVIRYWELEASYEQVDGEPILARLVFRWTPQLGGDARSFYLEHDHGHRLMLVGLARPEQAVL